MTLSVLLIMVLLFALGTPIAWSMALAATLYMVFGAHVSLQAMVQRLVGGIDSFPLLAIPFFVLAGNLMNTGGITGRLVAFSRALVGHVIGGLAHVVVVTNMIMAGMSGSAVADAVGTGSVLVPAMKQDGYEVRFAAAIVGAASTIGPIIPPSIPFVIYGSLANVSIGRLLLGGVIPGVLMGICLMIFVYFIATRRHYSAGPRSTFGELVRATLHAIPPLGMPVIILGGIVGGVATPTEAAAVGAAYAFILGCLVYGEIKLADLPQIIFDTTVVTASVGVILAAAQPISWVLIYQQAPSRMLGYFQGLNLAQWQVLLVLNIIFLVLGCFMECIGIMVMSVPILLPLLAHAGIDPVHFGVFFTLNLMIGNVTPPVGMAMYAICSLSKVPILEFSKEIWPFLIALTIALFLVTYIPALALWIPNMLMPVK